MTRLTSLSASLPMSRFHTYTLYVSIALVLLLSFTHVNNALVPQPSPEIAPSTPRTITTTVDNLLNLSNYGFTGGKDFPFIKSHTELVVARYNEDISWTDKYRLIRTVYNKGYRLPPHFDAIALKNLGRESHTYLAHIVRNYHRLADVTVFVQGQMPSWGFLVTEKGGKSGGHLLGGMEVEDLIFRHNNQSLFIPSFKVDLNVAFSRYRLGLVKPLKRFILSEFPTGLYEDSWRFWEGMDGGVKHIKGYIEHLRVQQQSMSFREFYHHWVRETDPADEAVCAIQGAIFAASRSDIHRHSLDYYKALLEVMSKSINPTEGYYMEFLWYSILSDRHRRDQDWCHLGNPADIIRVVERSSSGEVTYPEGFILSPHVIAQAKHDALMRGEDPELAVETARNTTW